MVDIWASGSKSPGVTNDISEWPWNWQIIKSLLVLLTTPVLFLLHHVRHFKRSLTFAHTALRE